MLITNMPFVLSFCIDMVAIALRVDLSGELLVHVVALPLV